MAGLSRLETPAAIGRLVLAAIGWLVLAVIGWLVLAVIESPAVSAIERRIGCRKLARPNGRPGAAGPVGIGAPSRITATAASAPAGAAGRLDVDDAGSGAACLGRAGLFCPAELAVVESFVVDGTSAVTAAGPVPALTAGVAELALTPVAAGLALTELRRIEGESSATDAGGSPIACGEGEASWWPG
ncbi:MAG TPA: hypothetical protein VGB75_05820 [Jatrophihabitans sp.]